MLNWYADNGRSFFWRNDEATNYELIISEIFLQRTKAETVEKFLPTFLKSYPNWQSLSEASKIEIQDSIKPIGLYNQRGERLYNLAQEIKRKQGQFPTNRNEVEDLPMVGQYIANAFELYIFKKNKPLIDVNMARVLERYFGERKLADIRYDKYLQRLAHIVTDTNKSKELNWAILDYAALVCKKKPLCYICMLNTNCIYYNIKYDK